MLYALFGTIGLIIGGIYSHSAAGALLYAMVGMLVAAAVIRRDELKNMQQRLSRMEKIVFFLEEQAKGKEVIPERQPSPAVLQSTTDAPIPPIVAPTAETIALPTTAAPEPPFIEIDFPLSPDEPGPAPLPPEGPAPLPTKTPPPIPVDTLSESLRTFITGGNLMVKVGVIILIFGFAFLVKYAAARNLLPIEVRLTGAFVAGIALAVVGWRLRLKRKGYAVTLQGGGVGIMYLTLFAAAKLFEMVPLELSFAVMVALVLFSGVLAVLQDASALAVMGAVGGFLAPVLFSTGRGSHVMLFSYYALLNAGIFGISWFKAWRWLNLLGFFFTFGIGSAWGLQYYRPQHFASTEPFLVLFFLFYLTIAVLFALRQPPRLKGYVDGTLVFGLPLVAFGLQISLVTRIEYGAAFSALAMGAIYIATASSLWRRSDAAMRTLVEAFLALGVIFASLAIPLALSGHWTAVAWSLEGAGLLWVGVRQKRWTARLFGLLLQVASGIIFLIRDGGHVKSMAVLNAPFLGGVMLALAGLFSAYSLTRHWEQLLPPERQISRVMLAWGLLWWFGMGVHEIGLYVPSRFELSAILVFMAVSSSVMADLTLRIAWPDLRWPPTIFSPLMALIAGIEFQTFHTLHPFQDGGFVAWPLAFTAHYFLLRRFETQWPEDLLRCYHVGGVVLATALSAWELGWVVERLVSGAPAWTWAVWGLLPTTVCLLLVRYGKPWAWPVSRWPEEYRGWVPALMVLASALWCVLSNGNDGDPSPLGYLPLFNPLDLIQMLGILTMFLWAQSQKLDPLPPGSMLPGEALFGIPSAATFIWLNAVVARTVHHWSGVNYTLIALTQSALFQAAIAVLWALIAMGIMIAAHRYGRRVIWYIGAVLLTALVVKLFVVDLSDSRTVWRIVSFLGVGGLLLIIGFFTPLPPAKHKGEAP
jgi:uncharacterized membrane protein